MKREHKMAMAALAAVAVLTLGVGYAYAQTGETTTDAQQGSTSTTTTGATNTGNATTTQTAPCPDRRHLVAGEVVKVEDNVITVKTAAGEEKTAKVDDKTVYRKDGADATLADVQPGAQTGIKLYEPSEGDEQTAKAVMIGTAEGRGPGWGRGRGMHGRGLDTAGEVTAVDGDKVTVKNADGSEKQYQIPGITQGNRIGVIVGPDGAVRGVIYDPPQTSQATDNQADQAQTSTGAASIPTTGLNA